MEGTSENNDLQVAPPPVEITEGSEGEETTPAIVDDSTKDDNVEEEPETMEQSSTIPSPDINSDSCQMDVPSIAPVNEPEFSHDQDSPVGCSSGDGKKDEKNDQDILAGGDDGDETEVATEDNQVGEDFNSSQQDAQQDEVCRDMEEDTLAENPPVGDASTSVISNSILDDSSEKELVVEDLLASNEERLDSDEESEMPMIRVKQFGLFAEDAEEEEDEQMNISVDPEGIHNVMQIEMQDGFSSNKTGNDSIGSNLRPRRAAATAAANVIREISTLEEEDSASIRRRRSRDKDVLSMGEGIPQVDIESQERRRCHVCKKMTLSKVTVRQYGQDVFFCTPTCFNVFRNPDSSRRSLPCAKCGIIQRDNSLTSTYYWETMNFCSDLCVGNYQIDIGSRCATCNKRVAWSSLGKYCVRFGSDVRQFCTALCLDTYKKNARVCFHCQLDIKKLSNVILANIPAKTSPKEFCSQDCVEMYIEQNLHQTVRHKPNQTSMCTICSHLKPTYRELVLPTGNYKVCSDVCWSKLLESKNVKRPDKCEICCKYLNLELGVLPPAFYVSANKKVYGFCSATCKNVYVLRSRKILACTTCKVKKYNYDLMEHIDENNTSTFAVCSLNCIPKPSQYIINLRETLTPAATASEMLRKNGVGHDRPLVVAGTAPSRIRTTIVSNDGSEINNDSNDIRIASVSSLAKSPASVLDSNDDCNKVDSATEIDICLDDDWNSKIVDVTDVEMSDIMLSVDSYVVFPPKEPAEQRNKGCLVRPFTKSVATQVDEELSGGEVVREKYIPLMIPVPVYIPFPFYGLESPAPVPFPVPLPIPIPLPVIFSGAEQRNSSSSRTIAESPLTLSTPFVANPQLQQSEPVLTNTAVIEAAGESSMAIDSISFLDLAGPNVGESDSFDILNTIPNLDMELGLGAGHHPNPVSQLMNPSGSIAVGNIIAPTPNFVGNTVMPSSDIQWRQSSVLRGICKIPDHSGVSREEYALREWQRHFGRDVSILCLTEKQISEKLQELVVKGRQVNGERYQPYMILYLCLGIQQYLRINNRSDKLFYDGSYEPFVHALVEATEVSYSHGICEPIVDEIHFWDSLELGANSPEVLVFTLVYYNYKYFHLKTWQEHASLMFDQVLVSSKIGQNGQSYKCLSLVGPISSSSGIEIHEMEPKTKCFIKLYEFYRYKCTTTSGPFYKAIIPQAPLKSKWYTVEPLSQMDVYRMLIRAMMVKG